MAYATARKAGLSLARQLHEPKRADQGRIERRITVPSSDGPSSPTGLGMNPMPKPRRRRDLASMLSNTNVGPGSNPRLHPGALIRARSPGDIR